MQRACMSATAVFRHAGVRRLLPTTTTRRGVQCPSQQPPRSNNSSASFDRRRHSTTSARLLADNDKDTEALKILMNELKQHKKMKISQVSLLLAGREADGSMASFKNKFGQTTKQWLEARKQFVSLRKGGKRKQYTVHPIQSSYKLLRTDLDTMAEEEVDDDDDDDDDDDAEAQEEEKEDLTRYTVKELQIRARNLGITPGRMRKFELIDAISVVEKLEKTSWRETNDAEISTLSDNSPADESNNTKFYLYDRGEPREKNLEKLRAELYSLSMSQSEKEELAHHLFHHDDASHSEDDLLPDEFKGQKYTANQEEYVKLLYESQVPIIVVDGPAGTGKTTIAASWAAKALSRGFVRRLVVTRPSVTAGEDLGFLPGTLEGKLKPYLLPIYDALADAGISRKNQEYMMKNGTIEVAPMSFLRGRTFRKSVIVADEMQNATPDQMKMLLTRLGQGSRMVVTGDLQQSDLRGQKSGLLDLVQRIQHHNPQHIRMIRLQREDVKRHDAVASVLNIYDSHDKQQVTDVNGVKDANAVPKVVAEKENVHSATLLDEIKIVDDLLTNPEGDNSTINPNTVVDETITADEVPYTAGQGSEDSGEIQELVFDNNAEELMEAGIIPMEADDDLDEGLLMEAET